MTVSLPVLVFSDLDGTLLDHESYSWALASAALDRLRDMGCGVVLATSKTAAEVADLRADIGFPHWPSIVENGGGLLLTDETPQDTGPIYKRLREGLRRLPPGFVGFGDMSLSEISERTGLTERGARLARMRRFSEPGIWTGADTDLDGFIAAAEAVGFRIQRGGRFLSVSFGGTKADCMRELIEKYSPRISIALGDAPNDIQMLEHADYGVIVANPAGSAMPRLSGEEMGRIRRTIRTGPEGWSDAVLEILDEISMRRDASTYG